MEDLIQASNPKNSPGMLDLLDDSIVFETVSATSGMTTTTSKSELQALARQSVDYFSERKQILRFLVLDLDSAVVSSYR